MVRIKPTLILGRKAEFSEEGVHCKLHSRNINGHRFLTNEDFQKERNFP